MERTRWLVVAAVTLGGCFYPADRGRQLEGRVDKLESENAQLRAQLKESQDKLAGTLPKIDQKIGEVTKALESLDKAARRGDADIGVQIQKAVEDVAGLRGTVETYVHRITELETALKGAQELFEKQLAELNVRQAAKEAEAAKKKEEPRPTDKKEFLAFAEEKAKAGDVSLARQLYAEFLKKWSKDDLVGEAHFGLGETFYGEEKCREALGEYGKVIKDHPKTRSAPNAYLRSAECFKKLKMNDESRLALEEVVAAYPKSDAAKTAKKQLDELTKKDPKKGKK